mmetsp:Transcript_26831/g.58468  ORF Transcript_26831/g.58468 Transcript_26831/m.58468 type:complete len:402 (-) Transcript_26831:426-1631(-)
MGRLGHISLVCLVLTVVKFDGAYGDIQEEGDDLDSVEKQLQETEREIVRLRARIAKARREVSSESQLPPSKTNTTSGKRPQMFSTVKDHPSPWLDVKGNDNPESLRETATSCTTGDDCATGKLCVDGFCKCPVLYTGTDCTDHIELEAGKDRCAMGFHHPRFKAEYNEKYKGSFSDLAMTRHIEMAKPTKDITDRADFSTCAVVGSSGVLRQLELGAEIDNHTAVIRFNDAPTASYEQWVGDKTTVRIQNLDFCGFSDRTNEMCYAYTASDRPCPNWKGWAKGKVRAKGKCIAMNPSHRNSKYIFWYWRMNKIPGLVDPACNPKCGAKMSAGFYGIMFALNVCGKVDLYGFGAETKKALPHYFTKSITWERKDWAQRHHWTYERYCMRQLRENLLDRVVVH